MNRKHVVFAVLSAALFVFVIGATWVVAANSSVIHACVNPAGQPRIVESGADCKQNETHLYWNFGIVNKYHNQKRIGPALSPTGSSIGQEFKVTCDSGDLAVGGVWAIDHRLGDISVEGAGAVGFDGWMVRLANPTISAISVNGVVKVTCWDITPP